MIDSLKPAALTFAQVQALALAKGAFLSVSATGGWVVKRPGGIFHTSELESAAAMLLGQSYKSNGRFVSLADAVVACIAENPTKRVLAPDAAAPTGRDKSRSKSKPKLKG